VAAIAKFEYSPAAHAVHTIDPICELCLPETHAVQLSIVPVKPALQMHVMLAIVGEELSGQRKHSPSPGPVLYVPVGHVMQSWPFAPCHPALQTQAVLSVLRAGEEEFAGQSMHKTYNSGQFIHALMSSYWLERHPQFGKGCEVVQGAENPISTYLESLAVKRTKKIG